MKTVFIVYSSSTESMSFPSQHFPVRISAMQTPTAISGEKTARTTASSTSPHAPQWCFFLWAAPASFSPSPGAPGSGWVPRHWGWVSEMDCDPCSLPGWTTVWIDFVLSVWLKKMWLISRLHGSGGIVELWAPEKDLPGLDESLEVSRSRLDGCRTIFLLPVRVKTHLAWCRRRSLSWIAVRNYISKRY